MNSLSFYVSDVGANANMGAVTKNDIVRWIALPVAVEGVSAPRAARHRQVAVTRYSGPKV